MGLGLPIPSKSKGLKSVTQPPIETLTEFKITADLRRIIDTAYVPNDYPIILAHVGPDDAAHVSFRGSARFHSDTAIRRSRFGRETHRADCPVPSHTART